MEDIAFSPPWDARTMATRIVRQKPDLAHDIEHTCYTVRCGSCRQTVQIHELRRRSTAATRSAECPYCGRDAHKASCWAINALPV